MFNQGKTVSLRTLERGKFCDGDEGYDRSLPQNFDIAKFHRGRQFFRNNVFSCTLSMFFSLIIGMSIPEFLDALIFTQQSDTPSKALKRYVHTFIHVLKWHYGNVWEQDSMAKKSIVFVRNLHENVRKRMEKDIQNHKRKFLSQYDMGVVLSGFMGGVIMYPRHGGIICSRKNLEDYVYFWYGIGHLLGIESEYNICSSGLDQALAFCKEIEQDIVYRNLKDPPPMYEEMAGHLLQAVTKGRSFTLLTIPVITALSIDLMEQPQIQRLKPADTVRYYIWKVMLFCIRNFSFLRSKVNISMEKGMEIHHGLLFCD